MRLEGAQILTKTSLCSETLQSSGDYFFIGD